MDDILRFGKKVIMRILLYPFRVFPVKKNRIILMNDLAKVYSDNPKSIAEYLIKNYNNKFDIIYPVKNINDNVFLFKKGIKPVKFNSLKYFYYTMTA